MFKVLEREKPMPQEELVEAMRALIGHIREHTDDYVEPPVVARAAELLAKCERKPVHH